jgi:itaconate CoA-transferase
VLAQPELANDARFTSNSLRVANKEALRVLIVTEFASLSRAEVIQRLETAQIANANVSTMQDVWAHPQLRKRERWREVESAAGPIPALIPPATSSAFAARMDRIPALGENSAAILTELGYDAGTIAQWTEQGVI